MTTQSVTPTSIVDDLENIYLESSSFPRNSLFDEQRKYPRTSYTDQIPVKLRVRDDQGEIFEPSSLLVNESFRGVALLVFTSSHLTRNQLCEVNFFREEWFASRIVWSQFIDDSVQEIGITYRF